MLDKKIKSYTIVPQSLYVYRKADNQLRQIIDDMGRPGYVLVSRQMGKTNLLLNAKRYYDSGDDCFTYIDVSNIFTDLRSFFRNIIDTVIEGVDGKCNFSLETMSLSRDKTELLQPHKEYEYELKALLKYLPGKLVICLDEIDALTKVDYSDQVFSLIRSIYFSGRTNFPEFKRLTFVLSGVADPAELIKNKAVSPFNIGEKIYLDDFSKDETNQLLKNSNIELSGEVIDRVYHWASGNPRITWELCSALEDKLFDFGHVDARDVDEEVKKLYLIDYDLPPIDHIRSRVEIDKDIRTSLIAIHYHKSSSLSDKIKDRLYLAGITTSKQANGEIFFRNRIIAESLSEKWLSDLERNDITTVDRAKDDLQEGRYSEALVLFESYISSLGDDAPSPVLYLHIGYCKAMLGKFEEAVDSFLKFKTEQYDVDFFFREHWLGISNLRLGRLDDAASNFRNIVESDAGPDRAAYYYQALLNLSSTCIRKEKESAELYVESEGVRKAEKLLDSIISSEGSISDVIGVDVARHIICSAYYQLYSLSVWKKEIKRAIQYLDKASAVAEENERITIAFERARLVDGATNKSDALVKCTEFFTSANSPVRDKKPDTPLTFDDNDCASLILLLSKSNQTALLRKVIDKLRSIDDSDKKVWDILTSAMVMAFQSADYASGVEMMFFSISSRLKSITKPEYKQMLTLSGGVPVSNRSKYFTEIFIREHLCAPDYVFELNDLRILHNIFSNSADDPPEDSQEFRDLSISIIENSIREKRIDKAADSMAKLFLRYWRILEAVKGGNIVSVRRDVLTLKAELLRIKELSVPLFAPNFKSEMIGFLSVVEQKMPPLISRKIGRNEIVKVRLKDGSISEGKFKKLEEMIVNCECEIVG